MNMPVYKDKNGTWRAVYRYKDWKGEHKQTQRRGFILKKDAQAWEREQLQKIQGELDGNLYS